MPDQAGVQSDQKSQNQSEKFTIKVDGQEVEVTKDELIELAQKGKDYTKKTQVLSDKEKTLEEEKQRVSGLKAIVDEMDADPKLKETLNKVYTDYKSGKISRSDEAKDQNLKRIDKLIDETSDPATREQLRDMRQIIREEAGDTKSLQDKIEKLEKELEGIRNSALVVTSDRVDRQLEELEEEFGKDIVGKYRKDITAMALKYPNQKLHKILYHFATEDEIDAAILNRSEKRKKNELKRKSDASGPGGESIASESVEVVKDKFGRVDWKASLQKVKEKLIK